MNKAILLLGCLFTCGVAFGNTFSSGYVITKDNSDTTVNLRDSENLQAKILGKIPNGTPMSCSVDASESPNFCFVKFDESQRKNTGFIYKSKLSFLDKDSSFSKVPLTKKDLYSAIYKNNQVSIKIKLNFSKLNKKEFSQTSHLGRLNLTYQGKKVYGTDSDIVDSTFLYSAIEIDQNGNKYLIPSEQFQGLFIPSYFVENDMVFDYISIYFNPKENKMYIFSTQADGAAIYTTVFELKNNRLVKRSVWSESD